MKLCSVTLLIVISALFIILPMGCRRETTGNEGKIVVAVTLLPQAGMVTSIGGDRVEVLVMVPPGASPHTYEVTPGQMIKLSRARVYFKVGSPVEFEVAWMSKLTEINRDMLVVDCSQGISLIESQDPDEPGLDPHIWLSARNAVIMAGNILKGLCQVDPAGAGFYEERYREYISRLEDLDKELADGLSGIKNRTFIVFHPAFGYFARDYGLRQLAVEQGGKEPEADYIIRLIKEAREQGVKLVLVSPQYDRKSAEVIAREIGGRVVTVDPLAEDLVDSLQAIVAALKQDQDG